MPYFPALLQSHILFGAENSISRVTKSRTNISSLIQLSVQMTNINLHIRMNLMKSLQSLRSRNHKHTLNALAAMFLNEIHSCNSRTAGSQHRVNHNDQTLIDRIRKLAVILMRLMSNRIT